MLNHGICLALLTALGMGGPVLSWSHSFLLVLVITYKALNSWGLIYLKGILS